MIQLYLKINGCVHGWVSLANHTRQVFLRDHVKYFAQISEDGS
jgi:hypothetical protein